jgi:hypothetical protein
MASPPSPSKHGEGGEAEGHPAPEEFPEVFFTVSYEDMASLQGPADRVWGHNPVEAPRPLSSEYKEEAS